MRLRYPPWKGRPIIVCFVASYKTEERRKQENYITYLSPTGTYLRWGVSELESEGDAGPLFGGSRGGPPLPPRVLHRRPLPFLGVRFYKFQAAFLGENRGYKKVGGFFGTKKTVFLWPKMA